MGRSPARMSNEPAGEVRNAPKIHLAACSCTLSNALGWVLCFFLLKVRSNHNWKPYVSSGTTQERYRSRLFAASRPRAEEPVSIA